jgi:hypothetical protein
MRGRICGMHVKFQSWPYDGWLSMVVIWNFQQILLKDCRIELKNKF